MTEYIDKDKVLYMLSGRIADCVEIADGANEETDKETKEKYLEAASRYTRMYKFIAQIPTVEAEPVKRGKWLLGGKCSECNGNAPFDPMASTYYESKYCPHCGAKMDGDDRAERKEK